MFYIYHMITNRNTRCKCFYMTPKRHCQCKHLHRSGLQNSQMSASLWHQHTGSANAFDFLFSLTAKKLGFNNDRLLRQMTFTEHLVVALTETTRKYLHERLLAVTVYHNTRLVTALTSCHCCSLSSSLYRSTL